MAGPVTDLRGDAPASRALLDAIAADDTPADLGAQLEVNMDAARRHALGAHYTAEADIRGVVAPTLTRPLQARVAAASTCAALLDLLAELAALRVLDPACGAGDFLRVAFAELVAVEALALARLRDHFCIKCSRPGVGVHQFFGIDVDPLAVALTRRTLRRAHAAHGTGSAPVDLDAQVICGDALFIAWPRADVILGNPPFQAKNRMRAELGAAYVQRLRRRYPDVPGRADYCVYWFRRAHDELPAGGRAGLVGTNTIRQNDSRRGGLAHIVAHGGVITEAVATRPWPGAAAVHVSIVHWLKGAAPGPKRLSWQDGDRVDGPWSSVMLDEIGPSLAGLEVGGARPLRANVESGACYQGQTHGHEAFVVTSETARALIRSSRRNAEVIFPYMIADDLLGNLDGAPGRYVIDFGDRDLRAASAYRAPFAHVEAQVLPDRQRAAGRERERNEAILREDPQGRVNRHHAVFLGRWWRLSWRRGELLARLAEIPRYIVCAQVTKRPIFEFIASTVRPNAALIVFPLADDYSFGVLQSQLHWRWFVARCSTLKGDYRYTSATVFDAFPWPQAPTRAQVEAVARAGVEVRTLRRSLLAQHGLSRRELYRQLDAPGRSPLADAHASLDLAVRAAYGMTADADGLAALLDLNLTLAAQEDAGGQVQGPGLPRCVGDAEDLVSDDAVGPRA